MPSWCPNSWRITDSASVSPQLSSTKLAVAKTKFPYEVLTVTEPGAVTPPRAFLFDITTMRSYWANDAQIWLE
jgi:hypothetical protein